MFVDTVFFLLPKYMYPVVMLTFLITVYTVTLLMESTVFNSTYNNNFIRMYKKTL